MFCVGNYTVFIVASTTGSEWGNVPMEATCYNNIFCVWGTLQWSIDCSTSVHTHPDPQINFFQDHTKIIICPLMSAVSYISEDKSFRNFRLPLIERHGCSKELYSRLRYAKTMTERLIAKMDSQSSKMSTEHQPTPIPTPTSMA